MTLVCIVSGDVTLLESKSWLNTVCFVLPFLWLGTFTVKTNYVLSSMRMLACTKRWSLPVMRKTFSNSKSLH